MGDFPSLGEPCPAPADRRYADRFSKGERFGDGQAGSRFGRRSLTLREASPSYLCRAVPIVLGFVYRARSSIVFGDLVKRDGKMERKSTSRKKARRCGMREGSG